MKKIRLIDSLDCAYWGINESVLKIKTSVINVCSDIDRYFRLCFGVEVNEPVNEVKFQIIHRVFPKLANMTLDQFNRLMLVFVNIRTINAHLHLRKLVFIDEDIVNYLSNIVQPAYSISKKGVVTMYGQAYIIMLLSQKYNIWPFVTSYFSKEFSEIHRMTGNEKSSFQTGQQHLLQEYCGTGKPLLPPCHNKTEVQYLNNVFKENMTKIIFGLEMISSNTNHSFKYTRSLAKSLETEEVFIQNPNILDLIIFLRNQWFHGTNLGDMAINEDNSVVFDYKFIMNSFITLKNCLLHDCKYQKIVEYLNDFAMNCLNFKVLRLIEVTYKILDNRLLTEDKVDDRIDNTVSAYNRLSESNLDYYELASLLIEPSNLVFNVGASKFLDFFPRKTICEKLRIVKFTSEEGFEIGDYSTSKQVIYLAMVDLNIDNQNTINGKYLSDYLLVDEVQYSDKISIFEAQDISNNVETQLDYSISVGR